MSDFFDIFSSCCGEREPTKKNKDQPKLVVANKKSSDTPPFKEAPLSNQLYSQSMKDLIEQIIFNLNSFSTPSNSPNNSPRESKERSR